MALAKHYEEILERLFEENTKLTKNLWPDKTPERNYVEHVARHLDSSKILLQELLELLTNPGSDALFDSADRSELTRQRNEFLARIDTYEAEIKLKKELIDSLNSECHQLQRKVDRLESENKELSRLLKRRKS